MGSYLSTRSIEHDSWKSDARFAMESGAYCVICGGPFDIEGDVYNLDPKEPRYQWLFDFRLLGYTEDVRRHRVTSEDAKPINTSDAKDIFLSEKCWYSMTGSQYFRVLSETRRTDIWFDALCYTADRGTLFPLHEACIDTSVCVIHHQHNADKEKAPEPLAVLCDLLNDHWHKSHVRERLDNDSNEANDIFGLCAYSNIYGPRSVLAMTKLEWWGGEYDRFYANPVEVPDRLPTFVFNVLLASHCNAEESKRKIQVSRTPLGIERLPSEILDAICNYVPARSVIALHRTSKVLAIKVPLDNTFWRDRLRDGSLHPHIWDLDTKRIEELRQQSDITFPVVDWDWNSVAKLLAMKRYPVVGRDTRLDDLPLELWNRCRIWNIIEEAVQCRETIPKEMERNDSVVDL